MDGNAEIPAYPTPYDDGYATCERTVAALRIYPGDHTPDWVTQRIGLEPTEALTRGRVWVSPSGRRHVVQKNGWFLSSEEEVESRDLRRHLDWLLDRASPVATRIRELSQVPGVTAIVHVIWWSAHAQGGPTLWPNHLRALADLGLELQFDISFYGEDDE